MESAIGHAPVVMGLVLRDCRRVGAGGLGHTARDWLCENSEQVDWVKYFDHAAQCYRSARFVDGTLESSVFIGPDIDLPPRDWIEGLFGKRRYHSQNGPTSCQATHLRE